MSTGPLFKQFWESIPGLSLNCEALGKSLNPSAILINGLKINNKECGLSGLDVIMPKKKCLASTWNIWRTLKIRFQLMLATISKINNKSDEEDGDDNTDIL